MLFIILLGLFRTFSFLKIIEAFSQIVTMLSNVTYDLRIFLFFYMILVILFSLLMGIIGLGNRFIEGPFRDEFGEEVQAEIEELGEDFEFPGMEYDSIGLFFGNIIKTLRWSLGDIGFDDAAFMHEHDSYIFWTMMALIVIVTNIVFLNFIISEATASYEKVKEKLEMYILAEKSDLIQ